METQPSAHPLSSDPGAEIPAAGAPRVSGRLYSIAVLGVLILLAVAIVAVYGRTVSQLLFRTAVAPLPGLTYVSDLDYWQRTPRETRVSAVARFDLNSNLHEVPLQIGDWVGVEKPETNQEVLILLQPEQYVQRLYQNSKGQYLWLSMVGGRNSQPFHAPDICYDADGWQYNLGSHAVKLDGGGSVYGLYLDAHKQIPDPQRPGESVRADHVVFYFYLFPNEGRELKDGIVLFKLTSGRTGTVEETLALHEEFVRQFFKNASPAAGQASRPTGL